MNLANGLIESIFYWGNGKICEHSTILNGKYHGEHRYYNLDGTLNQHNYNINNKLEGECLEYFYDLHI